MGEKTEYKKSGETVPLTVSGSGLEEFEEKMERLEEGSGGAGWLSSIMDQLILIKEELQQEVRFYTKIMKVDGYA